mgnify:CR=1 FL=1
MQIKAVAVAVLCQREDFVFVIEMADDTGFFQPPRELVDKAKPDQIIQPHFYGQGAAAGVAVAAQSVMIAMPGVEPVNVGRSKWNAAHHARRLTQDEVGSGVS